MTIPSLESRSSALSKARQYISIASSVRYWPARVSARVSVILVSLGLTRTARRKASSPSSDRPEPEAELGKELIACRDYPVRQPVSRGPP